MYSAILCNSLMVPVQLWGTVINHALRWWEISLTEEAFPECTLGHLLQEEVIPLCINVHNSGNFTFSRAHCCTKARRNDSIMTKNPSLRLYFILGQNIF